MSDHKKTAELRVTKEATTRYAIEMSDLEMKLKQLERDRQSTFKTTPPPPVTGVVRSNSVKGGGTSEKENQTVNGSAVMNVAADVHSLEHTKDVRDILLRANLGKVFILTCVSLDVCL